MVTSEILGLLNRPLGNVSSIEMPSKDVFLRNILPLVDGFELHSQAAFGLFMRKTILDDPGLLAKSLAVFVRSLPTYCGMCATVRFVERWFHKIDVGIDRRIILDRLLKAMAETESSLQALQDYFHQQILSSRLARMSRLGSLLTR